ncbi:MAG: DnaJ C-terminal domain-containing protein [Phycisphaerales bacterium]
MNQDHYDILGIARSATQDEIKAAYRRLARKYHPDVNQDTDATKRFAEVQEAYEVLSDPEKKQVYDRFGHVGPSGGPGPQGAGGGQRYTWTNVGGPSGFGGFGGDSDEFDIGSIFEDIFAGSGPRAKSHRAARARGRAERGHDLTEDVTVDFFDAVRGCKRAVKVRRGGSTQTIDVTIPKAVKDGAKLRIRGSGAPSPGSGAPGDLILHIHVRPHAYFERDGLDISIEAPLTIAEATLGARIPVPTLSGSATITVPAGIASGRRLRLKGQGLTDPAGKSGDLYVVLKIIAPTDLNEQDKALLRELGERIPSPRTGDPWNKL